VELMIKELLQISLSKKFFFSVFFVANYQFNSTILVRLTKIRKFNTLNYIVFNFIHVVALTPM